MNFSVYHSLCVAFLRACVFFLHFIQGPSTIVDQSVLSVGGGGMVKM